jgi:hypothetical protein
MSKTRSIKIPLLALLLVPLALSATKSASAAQTVTDFGPNVIFDASMSVGEI